MNEFDLTVPYGFLQSIIQVWQYYINRIANHYSSVVLEFTADTYSSRSFHFWAYVFPTFWNIFGLKLMMYTCIIPKIDPSSKIQSKSFTDNDFEYVHNRLHTCLKRTVCWTTSKYYAYYEIDGIISHICSRGFIVTVNESYWN